MPRRIPLRDLVPTGPVRPLAPGAGDGAPSGTAYAGAAQVPFPVLPVSVFGATYDVDLVLVDRDPRWDMHELARVATPDGPLWLCKDATDGTLEQTIVADHPDLHAIAPEIPLARTRSDVRVDDRSTPTWLDLDVRYTARDGTAVHVHYEGPPPAGPQRWRNSSTMGHSRDQVLVVLDVSHKAMARRASVTLDGTRSPLRRIACLVPFAVVLRQVQAGFAIGAWTQRGDGAGCSLAWAHGPSQGWQREVGDGQEALVQTDALRTLRHVFAVHDGRRELARAEVHPYGTDAPALVARFGPSLPDLAAPLAAPFEGTYALDVGGQRNHGVGRVRVEPVADGADVHLLPTAPRWTVDRPMVCRVRSTADGVHTEVVREVVREAVRSA
ncbi:MAG: hypothetical protein H6733_01760 [Alphaproteobacteria bacterium]|nr:hypothetical protein [Alphaproteobacteria bacterium]